MEFQDTSIETAVLFLPPSPMDVPTAGDVFDHRYYKLNKMFLKLCGLWPYQTKTVRSIIVFTIIFIAVGGIVPQIITMVNHRDDWDLIVEASMSLIFDVFCITKFFTSIFNSQKMLRLLNKIRTNWVIQAQDHDVNIFHKYAEHGRRLSSAYTVLVYLTWALFVTQPILPKIIDTILGNGTESGEFPVPVDYLIDDLQKYYYYVILHIAIGAFLALSVTLACDSMFMVYIQHGCGLYATLGNNLTWIGNNCKSSETKERTLKLDKPNMIYEHLALCIDKHNEAMEYSELIESIYSRCFLFIVGFNMFMLALTGIEIIVRTTEPQQTIRFVVTNFGCVIHLFMDNYMAQILMDHSIKIRYYILDGEWYKLPLKAQKILLVIIMRCNRPSKLTAGNIFMMSIESFAMFLKTSLSYFTLLHST